MAHTSMNRLGRVRDPEAPGDGHHAVLQGLAQGLQGGFVELRQLVQKQDTVVGQRISPAGAPCRRRTGTPGRRYDGGCGRAAGSPAGGWAPSAPPRSTPPWSGGTPAGSYPAEWTATAGPAWTCRSRGSPPALCPPAAAISSARFHVLLSHDLGKVRQGRVSPVGPPLRRGDGRLAPGDAPAAGRYFPPDR